MAGRTAHCRGGKLPGGNALRKLFENGETTTQIAERFGVTRDYVRRQLKRTGVTGFNEASPKQQSPDPDAQFPTAPRRITLPRVSMLAHMEKYA